MKKAQILDFLAKPNFYTATFILALSVALFIFYHPTIPQSGSVFGTNLFQAEVKEVVQEGAWDLESGIAREKQELLIVVSRGDEQEEAKLFNNYRPLEAGDVIYVQKGAFDTWYEFMNFDRTKGIVAILALFVVLVLATGRVHGWNALVGLFFSIVVIIKLIIPRILAGADPIVTGLWGSGLILLVALYVSHGVSRKSISALLGIMGSFVVVALLAYYTVKILQLTGFSDESSYLNFVSGGAINFAGLLVAGILIAAIGVLDDVAVTQASAVFALASAHESLHGLRLFEKAMAVGRDHVAAVVNTLVLAYAGAGLPLILIFALGQYPVSYIISGEALATEIVRTLVASIGILLAVPLTTLVATVLAPRITSASRAENLRFL